MKSKAIIAAALVAACAWGQYVQTNRLGALGRNSTVVTGVDMTPATNYTDAVAAEFENGTRQVQRAMSAGSASDAMFAYKVSGDEWHDQYNANDLMRASTNAAKAVVAPAAVAATNYTDAATNALAQTIGGGGGMPEWRQEVIHASMESVFFVTNGWMDVDVDDDIYVRTAGWPSGAAMFVRCHVTSDYAVMPPIRLVGYGTWPTNDFQSVWWRSGTNIFVNVLIEE